MLFITSAALIGAYGLSFLVASNRLIPFIFLIVLGSLIEQWLVNLFLFGVAVNSSEILVAARSSSGREG